MNEINRKMLMMVIINVFGELGLRHKISYLDNKGSFARHCQLDSQDLSSVVHHVNQAVIDTLAKMNLQEQTTIQVQQTKKPVWNMTFADDVNNALYSVTFQIEAFKKSIDLIGIFDEQYC